MKKTAFIASLALAMLSLTVYAAYAQNAAPVPIIPAVLKADVDNNGTTDVVLYNDGKTITRAEADTHNDGTPDIIVHTRDGSFDSAEVDTDNDGAMDKTFTDAASFNEYINNTHPAYNDILVRGNGEWAIAQVAF